MANGSANKSFVVRASAILTTGEVAGNVFDLNNAHESRVSVAIDFTVGSLTNCTFRYYVSKDGVTYYPLETAAGGVVSHVPTVDTTKAVLIDGCGWKFLKVSAQGSGTLTNSLAALSIYYLQAGSQR